MPAKAVVMQITAGAPPAEFSYRVPVNGSSPGMYTHAFNDPADPGNGGTWYADYGRRFCIWDWDAATKTVTVIRGLRGKRIDLSGIGEQLLTPEGLRERLPQLALEAAQRITEEG